MLSILTLPTYLQGVQAKYSKCHKSLVKSDTTFMKFETLPYLVFKTCLDILYFICSNPSIFIENFASIITILLTFDVSLVIAQTLEPRWIVD